MTERRTRQQNEAEGARIVFVCSRPKHLHGFSVCSEHVLQDCRMSDEHRYRERSVIAMSEIPPVFSVIARTTPSRVYMIAWDSILDPGAGS